MTFRKQGHRQEDRRGGSGKSYADVSISFGAKAPFQSGPDIVDGGKVGSPFLAGRQARTIRSRHCSSHLR